MGKINCTSTKHKDFSFNGDFNSYRNFYEFELNKEYQKLKDLAEEKKKPPFVEQMFGLNDYKKQYKRLLKWAHIALKSPEYEKDHTEAHKETNKFNRLSPIKRNKNTFYDENILKIFPKSNADSEDEFDHDANQMKHNLDNQIKIERTRSIKLLIRDLEKRCSLPSVLSNRTKAKRIFDRLINHYNNEIAESGASFKKHYEANLNISIKESRQNTSKFDQFDQSIHKHNLYLKEASLNNTLINAQNFEKTNSGKPDLYYSTVIKSALKRKIDKFNKEIHIDEPVAKIKKTTNIAFKPDLSGAFSAYKSDRRFSALNNLEISKGKDKEVKNLSDRYKKNLTNLISEDSSNNINSLAVEDYNGITKENVELNLRYFNKFNKAKFDSRNIKGPPVPFRWISWMISAGIPEKRDAELYNLYYLSYIKEEAEEQIKKDLNRTIPEGILTHLTEKEISIMEFSLYKLLRAFAANDPEVSYCQGMNYLANFLLFTSNFNEVEAFYMMIALFSTTFNSSFGIRGFYTDGFALTSFYTYLFHEYLKERNPKLSYHIINVLEMKDEFWLNKWFMSLYTILFPYEVIMRLWDYLFIYGLEFIVKFTLSLLEYLEAKIMKFEDTIDLLEFFKLLSPYENQNLINDALYNKEKDINKDQQPFISRVSYSSFPCYYKINLEEILLNSTKITFTKERILSIKRSFEKKHSVNLSKLSIKYTLDKAILTPDMSQVDTYKHYILAGAKRNSFLESDLDNNSELNHASTFKSSKTKKKQIIKFKSVSEKSDNQEQEQERLTLEKSKSKTVIDDYEKGKEKENKQLEEVDEYDLEVIEVDEGTGIDNIEAYNFCIKFGVNN